MRPMNNFDEEEDETIYMPKFGYYHSWSSDDMDGSRLDVEFVTDYPQKDALEFAEFMSSQEMLDHYGKKHWWIFSKRLRTIVGPFNSPVEAFVIVDSDAFIENIMEEYYESDPMDNWMGRNE